MKLLCIYHVGRLHISITPTCLDNLLGILKELSENDGAPGRLFAAAVLSTTKFENDTWRRETGQALVKKHEWISLVICMQQEPGSKCFEKCTCT